MLHNHEIKKHTVYAAEDELQHSMNGCMHVEIPQQKGDD